MRAETRRAPIAKRKRRRPNAGPQPVAKRPEVAARQEAARTRDRHGRGEPVLPSLRNVLGRTGFAAAVFFVLILLVLRVSPATALLEAVILAAIMAPLYLLLDRIVYRRRVKRWNAKRDARS